MNTQIERHKSWRRTQKIIAEENHLLQRQHSLHASKELIIDYKIAYGKWSLSRK